MLSKSKEKPIDTYLKLKDFLLKPVIICACEYWGDSMKKENFANHLNNPICQCENKY